MAQGHHTMEPRIQYAKTEDGVNIAFWTLGQGMPLVYLPVTYGHVQVEWRNPGVRRWYEQLARKRSLVRYDRRGSGLSDREVTDYSLDAHVLDVEAVVDRLGLESFALFGSFHLGQVAIACAARRPERVSHLILWCTFARGEDYYESPPVRALASLKGTDWQTYTEAMARASLGWSDERTARGFAELIRESVTSEGMQAFAEGAAGFDVSTLLPRLTCPTLVLHRRQHRLIHMDLARELAAQIPGARLTLLEGESSAFGGDELETVAGIFEEFLGEGEEASAPGLAKEDVHTILFTDVEASTSLIDRLGDAKARDILRAHERIVRDALRSHGGSEVKTMGDGFMASFSSATKALECAIAMQRAFEEHNETAEEPIKVRVGLNAGEPIAEEEDLFGTAVIVAARIAAKAEGGEIIASDVVRQLVAGKGFLFSDRGDTALRGFEDPVRLYEVRWREEG